MKFCSKFVHEIGALSLDQAFCFNLRKSHKCYFPTLDIMKKKRAMVANETTGKAKVHFANWLAKVRETQKNMPMITI